LGKATNEQQAKYCKLELKSKGIRLIAFKQTGERPNCDNHKAAADMFVKFAGLDVTGIAAVSCSRHTVFLPGGTVDFQKGEKYVD
jgi:hypothetical protein